MEMRIHHREHTEDATMSKSQLSRTPFLVLLIILVSGIAALAQNNKGAIVGTVKDPADALVSKAKITVTNSKNGEVRQAETGDDGTYTVTNLEPGTYNVTAESAGFQTISIEAVAVETNSRLPLDLKFTNVTGGVGTVTVTAESAPLVESETSVRGDIITGRQVTDLPIPQRNFTLLAALSPGVTRPNLGLLGGGGKIGIAFSTSSPRAQDRFFPVFIDLANHLVGLRPSGDCTQGHFDDLVFTKSARHILPFSTMTVFRPDMFAKFQVQ